MTSSEASEATPKRTRKKPVNFAKRRTLRFSDGEERAVEDVRRALAKSSGRDLEEVTFSEALRLLITDKPGTAEVEAMALAIERGAGATSVDLREYGDGIAYELRAFRNTFANIRGAVYQVAKKLNVGETAHAEEISRALASAAQMVDWVDDMENRMRRFVDRGFPPRRGTEEG